MNMHGLDRLGYTTVRPTSTAPNLPLDGDQLRSMLERDRCLVFRDFGATIEDFEAITSALSDSFHNYRGGGFTVGKLSRSTVNNNSTLMTATGNTQDFPMPLHGEMYYLSEPPELIWFYCDVPVESGGQTTVGDGRQIYRDLSPETQALLRNRRICYQRRMEDGDWQVTLQVETREQAEEFCRSQNMEITWEDDGAAVTHFYTSALREAGGELVYINSLLLLALGEQALRAQSATEAAAMKLNFVVRWEDGSPIGPEVLKEIASACARNEAEVSWKKGDMILVDNRSVMHGRRGSNGQDRRILVRMGDLKKTTAQAS